VDELEQWWARQVAPGRWVIMRARRWRIAGQATTAYSEETCPVELSEAGALHVLRNIAAVLA